MKLSFMIPTVILMFLVFSITKAQDNVFVTGNLTRYFDCKPFPRNDICPDNIKVIFEENQAKSFIDGINQLISVLKGLSNQSCIDAFRKTSCLEIPRCEPERLYVNVEALMVECKNANSVCPESVNQKWLNCTQKKSVAETSSLSFTTLKCKNIKDITGTCPDLKRKVSFPPIIFCFQFLVEE